MSDAISYQQKAVHLTPEGHADVHRHMNNLGNLLQCRFECTVLPIHAAGIYATSTIKAGSDFAISSYIFNVRALTERVNNPRFLEERKTAFS